MRNDVQTVVRLPSAVVREVDALAEKMSEAGVPITRAAVLRMLITQGVKQSRPSKPGKKSS